MDIIKKFNLPKYIKGKSFSEASKFIAKRFKDRNDPESVDTLNELQGRLKQAQEFVKQQQEARTKPTGEISNSFEAGGGLNQLIGNSVSSGGALSLNNGGTGSGASGLAEMLGGAGVSGGGAGASGYLGAATTALDLGQTAFGDTGIDTSGRVAGAEVGSDAGAIAGNAMKGAQAGSAFGGWGMAAGALIGGTAGFLGNKNKKKDAAKANVNFAHAERNKSINSYETGGYLDNDLPVDNGQPGLEEKYSDLWASMDRPRVDPIGGVSSGVDKSMFSSTPDQITSFRGNEISRPIAQAIQGTKTSGVDMNALDLNKSVAPLSRPGSGPSKWDMIKHNAGQMATKAGEKIANSGDLLRYAPAAMNAFQLAKLKRPQDIALNKLNTKYKKQLVDEKGMQNTVGEATDNVRNAILSSSGGSGSTARANLLASQLQGTKAMSDAYQKSGAENRQEGRTAQAFDKATDQFNIGQSNNEKNINMTREAAYETNKSKLLAQLGDDLGGVGKEELLKKYPELMGINYDWKGRHTPSKKRKKKSKKK